MPLHLFNDFIEDLWRDGVYKSENVDETIKTDPSIKEFISFSKTKSLYIMAIKNDSDAITGFVVAEFDNIETFEHNETRDSEINTILVEMIRKISPIVSNRYVFKKDKTTLQIQPQDSGHFYMIRPCCLPAYPSIPQSHWAG